MKQAHKAGNKKSPNYGSFLDFSSPELLRIALLLERVSNVPEWRNTQCRHSLHRRVIRDTCGDFNFSIAPQIEAITNASSAASELFRILTDITSDPLDPAGQKHILRRTCRNRDIEFSYPSRSRSQVLHEFNLTIHAGKTTA